MMKKVFVAALAALALVSCKKDQNPEPKPQNVSEQISFSVFTPATRAAQATTATLNDFFVRVFKPDASEYFENTVRKEGTNWVYSPVKNWPEGQVDFYANNPVDDAYNLTSDLKINDFAAKQDAKDQIDLLVAHKEANKDGGKVIMPFQHALTAIRVEAKNANAAAYKIVVRGVRLTQFVNKGTLAMDKAATPNFAWTLAADKLNFFSTTDAANAVELNADYQNIVLSDAANPQFMILPQVTGTWDKANQDQARLSVLLQIYNLNNDGTVKNQEYPKQEGKWSYAAVAIPNTFAPGKIYTYKLTFLGENGGAGGVDPVDPTDPTDPDVVDPDGKDPTDPVLNGPIIFGEPTVEDWIVEPGTEIQM